jgi:sugar phosphate isomerase/epimerase
MSISRRGFGRIAASALAPAAGLFAAKKVPIAVQLYSVRAIAQNDLAGVLKEVGRLGFEGVEFAGYYGHSAEAIRKMLDENKLRAAGTHTGLDTLLGEKLAETLAFNKAIGNKNLIVPGMPKQYRESIASWKEAAKVFNEISARVKPQGFVVGYHNHREEVEPKEGTTPFDAFFGAANNDVKIQLDVGHAQRGGADPVALIKRYPGRIISIHVKEYNPQRDDAPLGEGLVKWKEVFRGLESAGATEWYIVEEEARTCTGFECIAGAIQRLHKMGK